MLFFAVFVSGPSVTEASQGVVEWEAGVSLRTRPDPNVRGAQMLPRGTRFTILSRTDQWYHVRLSSGATGYVWRPAVTTIQGQTQAGACTNCSGSGTGAGVGQQPARVQGAAQAIAAAAGAQGDPCLDPQREPDRRCYVNGYFAPIMGPFILAMNQCAPGCSYVDWGVWGDARHQQRRSCHNSGRAIDIHAIRCDGQTYAAGTQRFGQFVSCVRGRPGLYTIYQQPDHHNHVDISFRSCQVDGVGKVQGLSRSRTRRL